VEKKTLVTAIMISALLFSAAAGIQLVNLGRANPYTNSQYAGKTGVPSSAPSPVVQILSPMNREYNTDSITLNFNASVEKFLEGGYSSPLVSGMKIDNSYYTADWLQNSTQIDLATSLDSEEGSNSISVSVNLTGIPDGKHVIRVYIFAQGSIVDPIHWYTFETAGYSQVNFTIDTTPPSVSVFPIKNEMYAESEVLEVNLNFTVNESSSKISYVLDGQHNVTLAGNTTLTGLSEGKHSLTVYAWDETGNIGASETVTFTIAKPEPLPTTIVAASVVASAGSIAVFGAVLLIYFAKRKR
jgi:hypothetical protein